MTSPPTPYLLYLKESGAMEKLYAYGLISYKPMLMLEIRLKTDALMRQGKGKEEAVRLVMASTRLSRATVYRYLWAG